METFHLKQYWPAPAKLNLALRIVGRRPDGYHRLQTIFQFLDEGDTLHFEPRSDGGICRGRAVVGVPEADDLSVRAAKLLQKRYGTPGVTIHLHKRLPLGGGLGGGSSNAATTLVALNHYWNLGLSTEALAVLGLELGADIPVFIHGHAAYGEDLGQVLTPLVLPEHWFVVLVPDVQVSTREIFQTPDLTRDAIAVTIRSLFQHRYANACEPAVFRRFQAVREAANWLARFGEARLTGTGACVYARFKRQHEAQKVLSQAPCRAFLARGCSRSPLQQRLQQEKMQFTTGP